MVFFAGKILSAAELNALDVRVQNLEADSGWVNPGALANGWAAYVDGTYGTTRYRKIGKLVQVRGLVTAGTFAATILTLPAGFRPSLNLIFNSRTSGTQGTVELRVFSNGTIQIMSGTAAAWFSLSEIMFFVD